MPQKIKWMSGGVLVDLEGELNETSDTENFLPKYKPVSRGLICVFLKRDIRFQLTIDCPAVNPAVVVAVGLGSHGVSPFTDRSSKFPSAQLIPKRI
jgi:hypothetical protein